MTAGAARAGAGGGEGAGCRGGAEEACARVRAVLEVGGRVADGGHALGREARRRLPGCSGLSEAGVALALTAHLETSASAGQEDLERFVARATPAARCHVVLSANVCTGALRAIAFGAATSGRVLVKASRRDPVLAEIVARALAEDAGFAAAGGAIELVDGLAKEGEAAPRAGDEVHVYGSDETIAAVAAGLAEGVALRAHGTGMGVAVVGADADVARAARELAADVVPFDQRGCLSPRAALVEGDGGRALEVGRALAEALAEAQGRVPRGALDAGTRAELRRYVETARALGACLEGEGFVVGCAEEAGALVVPPSARAVHVVPAAAGGVGARARGVGGEGRCGGRGGERGAGGGGARGGAARAVVGARADAEAGVRRAGGPARGGVTGRGGGWVDQR